LKKAGPINYFFHFIPLEMITNFIFDGLGVKMTEKCLKIAILGPSMPFGLGKFGHFRPEMSFSWQF